uniref:Uncharacterized protein n=1 Tax=Timema shepardi TaxID=629360 RepID=A0A7R9B7N1_TIMSH|nr:unnamed protein product [Timema shepardi]
MNPLDQLLWLEYVHFADRHLAPPDTVLGVCSRSTRNCPWFTELWRQKLFLMEKYHQSSHEDMQAVELNTTSVLANYAIEAGMWREYIMLKFPTENLGSDHKLLVVALDGDSGVLEQALAVEYTSASDYLLLWLAYADYMRRRIEQDSDQQDQQVTAFTELLAQACEHLAQRFGLKGDPQCILLQYWARIEAAYKGDMEKVRLLWNDIMTQGHSQFAEMWLEYILLESVSLPILRPKWPQKPPEVKKSFEELLKAPSAVREAGTIQLLNSPISMVYDLPTQVKDLIAV